MPSLLDKTKWLITKTRSFRCGESQEAAKLGGKKLSRLNYSAISKQRRAFIINRVMTDNIFIFHTNPAVLIKDMVTYRRNGMDIITTKTKEQALRMGSQWWHTFPKQSRSLSVWGRGLVGIVWVTRRRGWVNRRGTKETHAGCFDTKKKTLLPLKSKWAEVRSSVQTQAHATAHESNP